MDDLPSEPGTYALILRAEDQRSIRVGARGVLDLEEGWYVYVGSALGPGGLAARVGRHLGPPKARHWHIDHLLPAVRVLEVWYTLDPERREEEWARHFRSAPGAVVPLRGFGAGDCGCEGHLVRLPGRPRPARLRSATGAGTVRRLGDAARG